MNRFRCIHPIRRITGMLAGLAGALLAFTAAPPAAFATRLPPAGGTGSQPPPAPAGAHIGVVPPPGVASRLQGPPGLAPARPHPTVAHLHAAVTGGMPGWQITVIAIGAALLAAVLAVLLDRMWAARRRVTAPGT
jgi:hypothetical protein